MRLGFLGLLFQAFLQRITTLLQVVKFNYKPVITAISFILKARRDFILFVLKLTTGISFTTS